MATIKQVTEGLQILMKYCDVNEHNIQAEHDEIFAPGCSPDEMEDKDHVSLELLGWHWSVGLDSWVKYT